MKRISTETMKGDEKTSKSVSKSPSENPPPPPPPPPSPLPPSPTVQVGSAYGGVASTYTVHYEYHQVIHNYDAGGPSAAAKSPPSSIGRSSSHQKDNPFQVDDYTTAMQAVKKSINNNMPPETSAPFKSSGPSQLPQSQDQPPVYPQISKIPLFEERAMLDDDTYRLSSSNTLNRIQKMEAGHFNDLLDESKSGRLVVIVGAAGSGKTTTSIRLAKKFNEGPKETKKFQDKLCFRMEFKAMNYSYKLSLQDLLLKPVNLQKIIKADPNLREEDEQKLKNDAYTWIKQNDEDVVLIFDGYDQFVQRIKQMPPQEDTETKMRVDDLVATLFCGYFLRNSRVILTSRSHALDSLPEDIKHEATTYLLHDLSEDDMKRLLKQFTGDKYEEVLNALETKAPHLKASCCNPLLLQMYARAAFSDKPEDITSMTRIFKNVVESRRISKTPKIKLTDEVVTALCEVAYEAIEGGSVLISEELLRKHGLDAEQVQGFIFTVPGSDDKDKLVDGKHQLYFSHQTLHEYFAARYICMHMENEQFEGFVKTHLCEYYWFVVAQFLCGMVVDLELSGDKGAEKRNLIKCALVTEMKRHARKIEEAAVDAADSAAALPNIGAMARECQDGAITKEVAQSFPTRLDVDIYTPSDGHALGYLVKACEHRVELLQLGGDQAPLLSFLNEVKGTEGPIEELRLMNNSKEASDDLFDAAIDVLPKITDELWMRYWLRNRSEDSILHWTGEFQQKLNVLESDKNLKVVFKERIDTMKEQADLNYDELVEKLRQHNQVEERIGDKFGKEVDEKDKDVVKYIYITLTRDPQPVEGEEDEDEGEDDEEDDDEEDEDEN